MHSQLNVDAQVSSRITAMVVSQRTSSRGQRDPKNSRSHKRQGITRIFHSEAKAKNDNVPDKERRGKTPKRSWSTLAIQNAQYAIKDLSDNAQLVRTNLYYFIIRENKFKKIQFEFFDV